MSELFDYPRSCEDCDSDLDSNGDCPTCDYDGSTAA